MRPVTIDTGNATAALTEIQRASHENDLLEIAQNFFVGNLQAAQRIFLGSKVQTSAAGVGNGADVTEDTLFTFSLPSGSLASVGEGLTVQASGTLANNADNKTIRLYFGSQSYSLGTVATAAAAWEVSMQVYKTGSNTQSILCKATIGATVIATALIAGTQTDTAPIVIKVTGQAGTANANDIVANSMAVSGVVADLGNAFATWLSDCQKGGSNRTT